ncbi:hypothetical protein TNCV_3004161 [Trichonephila clavipes]|nr:hypothetical protein TNCV_3004161 [Trichonephila clavipes]
MIPRMPVPYVKKRSCAALQYVLQWVRCSNEVAFAASGVENTLSRKDVICQQHGGCTRGICNSLLQVPLLGLTRCKVTFF